jgi:hypothetical protein
MSAKGGTGERWGIVLGMNRPLVSTVCVNTGKQSFVDRVGQLHAAEMCGNAEDAKVGARKVGSGREPARSAHIAGYLLHPIQRIPQEVGAASWVLVHAVLHQVPGSAK